MFGSTRKPSTTIIGWMIAQQAIVILMVNLAGATKFPNDIEGEPQIECMNDIVRISVATTNGVASRLYAKGHHSDEGCFYEKSNNGSFAVGTCGMNRQRQLDPRGLTYGLVVVVQLHPLFVTKVDRAYSIKCFYMEAEKTVTSLLDVSMISTESLTGNPPMPVCTYELHSDSPYGPTIRYARVGDKVWHSWTCPSATFGILVHSCVVSDGQGNDFKIIDANGCGIDQYVIKTPEYSNDLTRVQQETHVFKFADRTAVMFNCQIKLCQKADNGCDGISPPVCEGSSNETTAEDLLSTAASSPESISETATGEENTASSESSSLQSDAVSNTSRFPTPSSFPEATTSAVEAASGQTNSTAAFGEESAATESQQQSTGTSQQVTGSSDQSTGSSESLTTVAEVQTTLSSSTEPSSGTTSSEPEDGDVQFSRTPSEFNNSSANQSATATGQTSTNLTQNLTSSTQTQNLTTEDLILPTGENVSFAETTLAEASGEGSGQEGEPTSHSSSTESSSQAFSESSTPLLVESSSQSFSESSPSSSSSQSLSTESSVSAESSATASTEVETSLNSTEPATLTNATIVILDSTDSRERRNILRSPADSKQQPDLSVKKRFLDQTIDVHDIETDVSQLMWVLEPDDGHADDDGSDLRTRLTTLRPGFDNGRVGLQQEQPSQVCLSTRTTVAVLVPLILMLIIATIAVIVCVRRLHSESKLSQIRRTFPLHHLYKNAV